MDLRATQTIPWSAAYTLDSLAFLCQDRDFLRCYSSRIKPEFYRNNVQKFICRAILNWWKKHQVLPRMETLVESLHQMKASKKHQELEDEAFYAETVAKAKQVAATDLTGQTGPLRTSYLEFIQARAIEMAAIKIQTDFLPNKQIEEIKKAMKEAVEVGIGDEDHPRDIGAKNEVILRHNWRKNLTDIKVPTGLPTLDMWLGGGLGPGELGVITAGPSRGKTTGLVQFTINAALSGRNVYYVSREQSFEKIGTKMDSCLLGQPRESDHLREATTPWVFPGSRKWLELKPQSTVNRWAELYAGIQSKIKFKKYKKPCNAEDILADIRLMETRDSFRTDLLVVDYADKMKPILARKSDSNYDMIGDIYQDVFDLCQELVIPCWTASQSNRAALNKEKLDLDDLGDSFKKAHIADVVIFFCQSLTEYQMGIPERNLPSQARLFVGKNRDNPARQQELLIDAYYAISTWLEKSVREIEKKAA